jgi:predicted amidohydrolase
MHPKVGEIDSNVKKSLTMIEEASKNGANLIVLPELANSGYVFNSREEAFKLSEEIPGGKTSKAWMDSAKKNNVYIVAGINERDDNLLYNSSVIIGPTGYIGTFRKVHLWNEENLFFEPGNLGFPVFKTPIGRIGSNICYDSWFPESFRLAALQGADIVCVPTNWVPIPGQVKGERAMAHSLIMAASHCNSIFIAAADRVGEERGQPFEGQSIITSYTGWPIAGPASRDKEEIIYAELNLADARRKRNWNEYNQPLRDRRTDVYSEMLGSTHKSGWH